MRVLVTGSSGHVGGAIAARLMQQGDEVVGLGRRLTRSNRALPYAIAADLAKPGSLVSSLGETAPCDAIVHAAASLEQRPYAPEVSLTNCLGTQQVLELADRWRVSSVVYISSLPLIGSPQALPIDERHPAAPRTAYHASKLYGEHLCAIACARGTHTVSLRLTSPVGPGMPDGRIFSTFVRRALAGDPLEIAGDGTRAQDYVDVRDVAAAVHACLDARPTGVLNIAAGRCVSNRELALACIELLGSGSEIRPTGTPDPEEGVRWEVSIAAARQAVRFEPQHTLEDSIRSLAAECSDTRADD